MQLISRSMEATCLLTNINDIYRYIETTIKQDLGRVIILQSCVSTEINDLC
jgi:hypothetical protein